MPKAHVTTLVRVQIAAAGDDASIIKVIESFMESGVEFVAVDMPHDSKFTIHMPPLQSTLA